MTKLICSLTLALAAMQAAPTMNKEPLRRGELVVPYFRCGVDKDELQQMVLTYSNPTETNATVTFEVFDTAGRILEIPYEAQNNGVTRLTSPTLQVAARGSGIIKTSAAGSKLQRGWLRITSNPPGAVAVTAHAWTAVGANPAKLVFTLHPNAGGSLQIMGPFTDGSTDQFILANNGEADHVTLLARARSGEEMCRATVQVKPGEFYKQVITEYLPCSAGKSATLEVQSESGNTAALVLLFVKSGEIIPIEARIAAGKPQPTLEQALQDLLQKIRKAAGL
jgi:hypothetical protein